MEDLQKKPVVIITGSNGLLGTEISKKLQDRYQIVGLDVKATTQPLKKVEFIGFDISNRESIAKALERTRYLYGDKVASVIHLAAYYDFSEKESPMYDKITRNGTRNFMEELNATMDVEQFIFSSTHLVYKPVEHGKRITEDDPLLAKWEYPQSKIDTEKIIREMRGTAKAFIMRIAGVYNDTCNSIPISHQIQRIFEKKFTSHFYGGDLLTGNSYIHMDDLIDAFVKAVDKRAELPKEAAVNISDGESPTYDELQDEIGLLIYGKQWKTVEMPKELAQAGSWVQNLVADEFIKPWMMEIAADNYALEINKAKKLLEWTPKHTLKSTLPRMIDFLKNDPKKFYAINKLETPSEKEIEKHLAEAT
jgi:UDP-glucose 4-epimerase